MDRRKAIIKLYSETKAYATTGRVFGVSRQRVHQIVEGYKNTGRPRREKKYAKKFYKKKCEICLSVEPDVLHHKNFDNKDDSVENLQPVCKRCHNLLHKARKNNIKYYKNRYEKCKRCGGVFNYDKRNHGNGYCYECYLKLSKIEARETGKVRKYFDCNGCGEQVDTMNNHLIGYCEKCHRINKEEKRDPRVALMCEECGVLFHPLKNWMSIPPLPKYCSMKCYTKFRRKVKET